MPCRSCSDTRVGDGFLLSHSINRGEEIHRGRVQASAVFSESETSVSHLEPHQLMPNLSICIQQQLNRKALPKSWRYKAQLVSAALLCPKTSSSSVCRRGEQCRGEDSSLSSLRPRKLLIRATFSLLHQGDMLRLHPVPELFDER